MVTWGKERKKEMPTIFPWGLRVLAGVTFLEPEPSWIIRLDPAEAEGAEEDAQASGNPGTGSDSSLWTGTPTCKSRRAYQEKTHVRRTQHLGTPWAVTAFNSPCSTYPESAASTSHCPTYKLQHPQHSSFAAVGICLPGWRGRTEKPGDTRPRVFVRAHCTQIYNPQTGLSLRLWFLSKPRWAGNVLPLRVHLWELQPGLMGTAHSQAFFCSVQWLSRVRLSATPWIAACQASLSITTSQSLLKLMSIESVMTCNQLWRFTAKLVKFTFHSHTWQGPCKYLQFLEGLQYSRCEKEARLKLWNK